MNIIFDLVFIFLVLSVQPLNARFLRPYDYVEGLTDDTEVRKPEPMSQTIWSNIKSLNQVIEEKKSEPFQTNYILDNQNPSSNWSPETDNGSQAPFKYPFSFANKKTYSGGWSRHVTARDLPIAKHLAGVQMRLIRGGVRALHWQVSAEWAYIAYGKCRITALDRSGRGYVEEVTSGDVWYFPGGVPHSVQGVGDNGCFAVMVVDDNNFNELETFLLTDWIRHVPSSVLAKNFAQEHNDTFRNVPQNDMHIFMGQEPRPLEDEQHEVSDGTDPKECPFTLHSNGIQPNKTVYGGHIKIIDRNNFPITGIAAAIVTLKPGAIRELHWNPDSDEWQYYVDGTARMGVFTAEGRARTMDFTAGDVGYVQKSRPHFVENTGDTDLVFLEVFPTPTYEDISLGQWLAHTPSRLVDQHIRTGDDFIHDIKKTKSLIEPQK